jgi:hypothetical protein
MSARLRVLARLLRRGWATNRRNLTFELAKRISADPPMPAAGRQVGVVPADRYHIAPAVDAVRVLPTTPIVSGDEGGPTTEQLTDVTVRGRYPEVRTSEGDDVTAAALGVSGSRATTTRVLTRLHSVRPRRTSPTTPKAVEEAVVLGGIWAFNYYHWVVEELGRLVAMGTPEVSVIIDGRLPGFARESLEQLGYRGSIIRMGPSDELAVDRLHVPGAGKGWGAGLAGLRDRVRQPREEAADRRIYATRQADATRYVQNVEELTAVLESYGFETVAFGELSFEEELELLSETAVLLGPHGAGLTSLLWGHELDIIELFNTTKKSEYERLAQACGHRYDAVFNPDVPVGLGRNNPFVVDTNLLQDTLDSLL